MTGVLRRRQGRFLHRFMGAGCEACAGLRALLCHFEETFMPNSADFYVKLSGLLTIKVGAKWHKSLHEMA